jgi:hypothetical protein
MRGNGSIETYPEQHIRKTRIKGKVGNGYFYGVGESKAIVAATRVGVGSNTSTIVPCVVRDEKGTQLPAASLGQTASEAGIQIRCHVVSVTDPYGRILCILDLSRYFLFQVAPQLYSRG